METLDYLKYIVEEIHSTVFATVDREGRPVTCAIDIMDSDDNGLYFLTANASTFPKSLSSSIRSTACTAVIALKSVLPGRWRSARLHSVLVVC